MALQRAPRACSHPGCTVAVGPGSECPRHPPRRSVDARPSSDDRGYNSKWRRFIRPAFLKAHPLCIDCGGPSEVPDHDPVDRVDLVAAGDPHPDAWHHLQPRCTRCHNARSARRRGRPDG